MLGGLKVASSVATAHWTVPGQCLLQWIGNVLPSAPAFLSGLPGENVSLAQLAATQTITTSLVFLGQSIPRRIAEKILGIDFTEPPPGQVQAEAGCLSTEGGIVLVQSSELLQQRKPISGLPTWLQCFGC